MGAKLFLQSAVTSGTVAVLEVILDDEYLTLHSLLVGGMVEVLEAHCKAMLKSVILIVCSDLGERFDVEREVFRCH